MKQRINYILLGALLCMLGCQTEYPDITAEIFLGGNDNAAATRRFPSCTILYELTNTTGGIDQVSQRTALRNVADLWGKAHGYLDLADAAGQTPAITVTFTDSADFEKRMTTRGLVSQPLSGLATIVRGNNGGTCAILLRKSYQWTLPVLQRVLLYQVGVALGLKDSDDAASAMSKTNISGPLALSKTDSSAIAGLYDQPCDSWAKINDRLLLSSNDLIRLRTTFNNQNKGFLIIDLSGGANKVMEFAPTSAAYSWTERKPFPGEATISNVQTIVSFNVGERMFAGNLYTTKPGKFWEYIAATPAQPDSWKPVADCPLRVSDAQCFGSNGKGYIITSIERNSAWQVIAYDPATDKWDQQPTWALANSETFTKVSNIPAFQIDPAIYMLPSNNYWRFDPLSPGNSWQKTSRLGVSGTFYPFSGRDSGFLFKTFSTQLWRLTGSSDWQLCKALPERLGDPYFAFSIAKRVFVCWNTDLFYKYNP